MESRASNEQRLVQKISKPLECVDEDPNRVVNRQVLVEEMKKNGLFSIKSLLSTEAAQQVAQYVDEELMKSQQSLKLKE